MSKNAFNKKGLTLVELLVTVSIMCLLLAISITTYTSAKLKINTNKANSDLKVINLSFEKFLEDYDDLPPIGIDHCSACALSELYLPYTDGTWQDIVDIFRNANYPFRIPSTDPWGNPYAYDKNYKQACDAWSIICSTGPNKVLETDICQLPPVSTGGDDICIWIPDNDPYPLP